MNFTILLSLVAFITILLTPSSSIGVGYGAWPPSRPPYGMSTAYSNPNCDSISRAVLKTIRSPSYDKEIRPKLAYAAPVIASGTSTTSPTAVSFNMLVYRILEVNELEYTWTLDVVFRQYWNDYRLRYSTQYCPNYKFLTLTTAQEIWTPATFFPTEKEGHLHQLTKPNVLVRIHPNGDVIYSERLTMTMFCDDKHPDSDGVVCQFRPASYSYVKDEVELFWSSDRTIEIINPNIISPRNVFTLGDIDLGVGEKTTAMGTFRYVFANFHFVKK